MINYQNPFRYRASEQQRDLRAFLRSFGPAALHMLPEAVWDRLLVLRSAPGAGKTSLMRVFTAESTRAVIDDRDTFRDLAEALTSTGAIQESSPCVLGAYINLERDYRSLIDISANDAVAQRLFFRLLDVRVMLAFVRAALVLNKRTYPEDVGRIVIRPKSSDASLDQAAKRLGGLDGAAIYTACAASEKKMLEMLDSLLPVEWEHEDGGHNDLYSLRLLSASELLVDGEVLDVRPLIMFDDGHRLHPTQRGALLERLADRGLDVARWYAERYEALSRQDLLDQVGKEGRDLELVELESIARGASPDGKARFSTERFEKMLIDIANRRAFKPLSRSLEQEHDFSELLEFEDDELLLGRGADVIKVLREQVAKLAGGDARYTEWLQDAAKLSGYEAALRLRELDVLIRRDRDRTQTDLFSQALTVADSKDRSNSGIREAAALALAQAHGLPYYAGTDLLPKLGSRNVEQFLALCGDLFAEMHAEMTLQRKPKVSAQRQDRIVQRASQRYWKEILRRVPDGHLVQQFVLAIIKMAEQENIKATIPYPPGVTGTALHMSDRERLLDPKVRESIPGADFLLAALSNAISFNIVSAELDRSVKNKQVMVIYLNRLLCPMFKLPLGRGGYREKKLEVMAKWMTNPIEGALDEGAEQLSF
jgi:hypothetical protein